MPSLSLTFYRPLLEFYECLVKSFPHDRLLLSNHDRLRANMHSESKQLLGELGPAITKELLGLFLRRDERFFDESNPFVQFLGGRRLYDMLEPSEQEEYWGPVLENIIRQGIVMCALLPKMDTLENLASNLVQKEGLTSNSPMTLMKHVMTNPEAMSDVMSLVEGENGVKNLMGMLKSIVHGVSDTAESVPAPDATTHSVGSGTPPSISEPRDLPRDLNLAAGAAGVHGDDADDAAPSDILRRQHQQRRARETDKRSRGNHGLDDVCRLIDQVSDDQLGTMQNDIDEMTTSDMQNMMGEVCGLLENTNMDNPLEALQTLSGIDL